MPLPNAPGAAAPAIICQIGAREHYAIPRALLRAGRLAELITDIWIPPGSLCSRLPGKAGARLRGRYDRELATARVTHFTVASIAREATKLLAAPRTRWEIIGAQNAWFQACAVRHLEASGALAGPGPKPLVMAYSYAARDILALAKRAGARTVLLQIDGGEADEKHIQKVRSDRSEPGGDKAPASYWELWREECRIADRIFVNSEWSRNLMRDAGIDAGKIFVVPVICDAGARETATAHDYPGQFSATRPLRALFLGALILRKGVMEVVAAAAAMKGRNVEFTFVGGDLEGRAAAIPSGARTRWLRAVPREEVAAFYRAADVFLFPSHSDGFGMTQMEALASGLPVIASRNCASLVEDGKTGLLLEEVCAGEIARALGFCIDHPEALARMSAEALAVGARFRRDSEKAFFDSLAGL